MKNRMLRGVSLGVLSLATVILVAFTGQGQTQEKKVIHTERDTMVQLYDTQ